MAQAQTLMAKPRRQANSMSSVDTAAPPDTLTWEPFAFAAEIYWPGVGRPAVEQLYEWAVVLFDGKVTPAPLIFDRPGKVQGMWFPLSENQRRGHEPPPSSQSIHMDPIRLRSISKLRLLRGLVFRYLESNRLNTSPASADWCSAIMQAHFRLTGTRIWASPEVRRFEDEVVGEGNVTRRREVIEQAKGPNGQSSLPAEEIRSWPLKSVPDLGSFQRE